MSGAAAFPQPRPRLLFVVVFVLTAFQTVFLIAERRVPLGHETGRRFGLQHSFAAGVPPATAGGRSWVEQGLLLQNALLPLSPAFRSAPFLPLFHAGMFLEELVFLVGVWLLGSRIYRSACSRYVVAVAALGSCLWIDHAASNFLAYSALPLLLYFLHEFLETGTRPPLLMAALLTLLQVLGRPPEFALLVPAAAVLYWGGASLLFGYPLRERWKEIRWTRRDGIGAVCLFLPAIILAAALFTPEEIPTDSGRRGFVSSVLAGAGLQNPSGFLDLVLGMSPSLDSTVYCGYFTLAFALSALGSWGFRTSLRFLGFSLAALLALACLPPLLGALLSLPSRPASQTISLLRLLTVFVAGVGCDRMIETRSFPRRPALGLLLASGLMFVLFVFNPLEESLIRRTARALTWGLPGSSVSPLISEAGLFKNLAGAGALGAGLAGAVLLLRASGWRRAPFALALLLVLHPLDVFGWKFRTTWLKSFSLSRERAAAQSLAPSPPSPFPGVEPLRPPVPASFEGPYGEGATPLRPIQPVAAAGVRAPLPIAGPWVFGACSIVLIGWTLRRTLRLAAGAPAARGDP